MRFPDFLRTAVLLFCGSATMLAAVAIAGGKADDDTTLIYIAVGWWATATVLGLWLGRRPQATHAIERLMATAKNSAALPELEPGTIIFNRLWALIVYTVAVGAVAFLIPQLPAIGAGYPILAALYLRKQSLAVIAIEERDGVRFYVERSSPFKPLQLLRTAGLRKEDPVLHERARDAAHT